MTVPAKLIPRQWFIYRNVPRERIAEQIKVFIAALDFDKPFRVTVTSARATRSDKQLRYLNGVCYKIIGDAVGYERDEVSDYLNGTYHGWKDKRVPKTPRNPEGIESVPIRTSTRDADGKRSVLTKLEFSEYVAFIQRFAASKGLFIPDPDPDYALHREEEAA